MPGEKMAKTATKTLVAATLLSFAALPALSRDNHGEGDDDQGQIYHGAHDKAPEIDPGQVVGALALLSGTVAVISRYRRKK
jgi:hypothetical protein